MSNSIRLVNESLHAYTASLEDTSSVLAYRKKNQPRWQALLEELDQETNKRKHTTSYMPGNYQQYLERFQFKPSFSHFFLFLFLSPFLSLFFSLQLVPLLPQNGSQNLLF